MAYFGHRKRGSFFLDTSRAPCEIPEYGARERCSVFQTSPREAARDLRRAAEAARDACRKLVLLLPRFAGPSYRFKQGFYPPYYRIADFYLPDLNIIVEIDGPCHDIEEARRCDAWFEQARGIKTFRLTNERVLNRDFAPLADFIREAVDRDQRSLSDSGDA